LSGSQTKASGLAGGYLRVPGMTHMPNVSDKEAETPKPAVYRTEGPRQQGKGVAGNSDT